MIDVTSQHGEQNAYDRLYASDEGTALAKVRVHAPKTHVPGHLQIAVSGVPAGSDGKRVLTGAEPIVGNVVVQSDSEVDVAKAVEAMRRDVAARVHRAAGHAAQAAALAFAPPETLH